MWNINVNHSYSQALLRSHEIRVTGAVGGVAHPCPVCEYGFARSVGPNTHGFPPSRE